MLLPRYDRQGASSRLRSYQFIPLLKSNGVEVRPYPLLPNEYLTGLYQRGRRGFYHAFRGYLRRLQVLLGNRDFDLLWVEKEFFPWLPLLFEQCLIPNDRPLLLDYDDAIFHNYDLNKNPIVRGLLRGKIDGLMSQASAVTTGNSYLAQRAQRAGARRIEHLPTVVDLSRYVHRVTHRPSRCNVGWIGTPQTASYLHLVQPTLSKLSRSHAVRAVLIGPGAIKLGVPAEIHSWFEDTEVTKLEAIDIGIMPLPDEPWERGKCGYKLIQYMAAGIPVIASPVGVNVDIVREGVNGFLAATPEEWERALSALALDPELRTKMGAAGRAMVEERYSVLTVGSKLTRIIRELAEAT
jgi:glycosyltransferase involved in cell wall biosynthesis